MVNFMTILIQFLKSRQAEHIENREILGKMIPDNQAYDEVFITHLFESYRFSEKDTKTIMDIVDNVRADILQAQDNGVSAQEYFGKPASELAREFIENLPNKKRGYQIRREILFPIYLVIFFGILLLSPWLGGELTPKNVGLFLLFLLFNIMSWGIGRHLPTWLFKIYPKKQMKDRVRLVNMLTTGFQVSFIAIILIMMKLF